MNYELGLELKNAGFLQPDMGMKDGIQNLYGMGRGEWKSKGGSELVYIPTLSELIDVCDKSKGFQLMFLDGKNVWVAFNGEKDNEWYEGSTPEEAVARLWLALNKK